MSSEEVAFGGLMEQVRDGSQEAAWELIARYGDLVRRMVSSCRANFARHLTPTILSKLHGGRSSDIVRVSAGFRSRQSSSHFWRQWLRTKSAEKCADACTNRNTM